MGRLLEKLVDLQRHQIIPKNFSPITRPTQPCGPVRVSTTTHTPLAMGVGLLPMASPPFPPTDTHTQPTMFDFCSFRCLGSAARQRSSLRAAAVCTVPTPPVVEVEVEVGVTAGRLGGA